MFEKVSVFLKRHQYIILHLGMAVFYLLFFYVICESSYSADDLFNANAAACNYIEGDSVWKLTIRQWQKWFSYGRFYPFSNYTYLLFSILPNRFCYKLLILISVYINSLLMAKCVEKVTGSQSVGLMAMLLFPFSLQLTPRYDGPLYCFHMLMQVVMLGSEIAMLTVFNYLDNKEKKKHSYWILLLGALTYLIALGTYEIAFVMAAFLGLGAWAYTGSVKKSIQVLLPNIVVFVIMLCLNLAFRFNSTQSAYDGISINLDPKAVVITFLKQLYSTFPCSGFLAERFNHIPLSISAWLHELHIRDGIMIIIFITLVISILKILESERKNIKSIQFIFFIGLSLFVFPAMLMSVMTKYQNELWWGRGHISNYTQNFGLMLILLSLVLLIQIRAHKKIRTVSTILFIILGIPLLLTQLMESRLDNNYMYWRFGYCRDTVLTAGRNGIFEDIDKSDILFGTSDYIFDSSETKQFYTYAARKEIQGYEKSRILPKLSKQYGIQTTYKLANTPQEYYATSIWADINGGYILIGQVQSIEVSDDATIYTSVTVENPKIFIIDSPPFDLTNWILVENNRDGSLYTYYGTYTLP